MCTCWCPHLLQHLIYLTDPLDGVHVMCMFRCRHLLHITSSRPQGGWTPSQDLKSRVGSLPTNLQSLLAISPPVAVYLTSNAWWMSSHRLGVTLCGDTIPMGFTSRHLASICTEELLMASHWTCSYLGRVDLIGIWTGSGASRSGSLRV